MPQLSTPARPVPPARIPSRGGQKGPVLAALALAALGPAARAGGGGVSAAPDAVPDAAAATQIDWQRSLDDALSLSRAEGRRLLIAINADGESASERIVRERYRDPEFVAWTRPFVCVVASVFRHAPRDVDLEGRRIPCPRLGTVTCGEHIALEPLVHERYLAGTEIVLDGEVVERISPRHAVVTADGDKTLDLFLLFDLTVIDRELAAASDEERARVGARPAVELPGPGVFELARGPRRTALRGLVGDPSAAARAGVEALAEAAAGDRPGGRAGNRAWAHALADAVLHAGDPGAVYALARIAPVLGEARAAFLARTLRAGPALSRVLQARVQARGLSLALAGDESRREAAFDSLALLGRVDPGGTRTLRFSHRALPSDELGALLERAATSRPPSRPPAVDERPSEAELVAALEALDARRLDGAGPSGAWLREHALALLGLARRRIESGSGAVSFLLQDAATELDAVLAEAPRDVALRLERARCAFYLSDFEEQERAALAALEDIEAQGLSEDTRVEALRWLGDAAARLIVPRSNGGAEDELAGLERAARALSTAALSSEADATDWVSFASYFGATGRPGEQCAAAAEGLERFPESDELRALFGSAVQWVGEPSALVERCDALARAHPDSGSAAWYAGWARINLAEWLRRGERPDEAIAAYAAAADDFTRAGELVPAYADSVEHYRGAAALGRGFAHLLADRRGPAADCLVEAIDLRPGLDGVRDGLEREPVDLVDGALEWRRSGPSPVDGVELAERLLAATPGSARFAGAVADALLREGLRALARPGGLELGLEGLRGSVRAARLALTVEDEELARRALAQSATSLAEALLERGIETAEPGPLLGEAAAALGQPGPEPGAGSEALWELAARLRALLGPARPVARTGR